MTKAGTGWSDHECRWRQLTIASWNGEFPWTASPNASQDNRPGMLAFCVKATHAQEKLVHTQDCEALPQPSDLTQPQKGLKRCHRGPSRLFTGGGTAK